MIYGVLYILKWLARFLPSTVLQEYIRLYKKKFNGPQSSFHWRRSLPPLTAEVVRDGWCGIFGVKLGCPLDGSDRIKGDVRISGVISPQGIHHL